MSVNKVILIGNVGKDPDVRYMESGVAKCTFPLATSETYKNKSGEKTTHTEWHNIVIWRELAKVAEMYVKKGTQLYIEGKITTRRYQDKDGIQRQITEIVADTMQMLGRRPETQSAEDRADSSRQQPSEPEEPVSEPDDLPF